MLRLLLGGIGLTYLVAFLSLLVQVEGLVGADGILPNEPFFAALAARSDVTFADVPSLCWGSGCRDGVLVALCWLGAAAGVLLAAGRAQLPAAIAAWVAYLSLFHAGQIFLGYQWDLLLLEAGLLAVFATAWRDAPPPLPLWLFRWLLFRLVFASGVVKLSSGDPTWWDLSALTFHYETQPLPYWTSWWMHQLPQGLLRASTAGALGIELLAPLLYLGPRRARQVGAALTAAFMLLIAATGNYGFFNLLTLVLCLSLLDDEALPARLRRRLAGEGGATRETAPRLRRALLVSVAAGLVAMSIAPLLGAFRVRSPAPLASLYAVQRGFRITNGYGLFASMTTTRPEIEVQGSADGRSWQSYRFPYKVDDPTRAPRFAGPHMPRLDWQLWFAALRGPERRPWLHLFAQRLLDGEPEVRALLAHDPFPDDPPRYVRVVVRDYRFTDRPTRRETGAWWALGPARVALVLPNRERR